MNLRNLGIASLLSLGLFFIVFQVASATSIFITQQGGTGSTSPSGILYGDNGATTHLNTVSIGSNLTFIGGTLSATGGSGTFPFTPATDYGVNTSATTTALWGQLSLFASSTSATPALAASNTSGPAAVFGPGLVGISSTSPGFGLSVNNTDNLKTGYFYNPTPTTGKTQVTIRGGAGNLTTGTTDGVFQVLNSAGTLLMFVRADGVTGSQSYDTQDDSTAFLSQNNDSFSHPGLNFGMGSGIYWSAATQWWSGAKDLGLSRLAGGVLALGNGVANNIGATFVASNLGLGTTSPFAQLAVIATSTTGVGAPRTLFAIASSTGGTATSTLFSVNNIGTLFVNSLPTGFVQSVNGTLSSAALTSGQITTALGFTPFGGTNPLPVANGGTNDTSLTGDQILYTNHAGTQILSTASSTLFSPTTAGFVWAYENGAWGAFATSSTGGGGGVSSVGLSLPTGFTVSGSPVTTTGTLTAALAPGYSVKELPSWTVGAAGSDFTTIQAALNACGTAGGGNINLVDATYAQGGTGLSFKGSNCHLIGRGLGTTTITFTGAITYASSTASATNQWTNNSIENLTITGDGNTASIVFNLSDQSHFTLQNTDVDNAGTWIRANDTTNLTFYDRIVNNTATTLTKFGIDASSTNPVNAWYINDNFIGCSANCTSIQFNNANGNDIDTNFLEPASLTGTVGINLFDNTLAANNGVFNNVFNNNYIEAAGKGIAVAKATGPAGGIQRNRFSNNTVEANTLDYVFPGAATSTVIALQSWDNNYNSNFDNPLTSFQGPFGIGTSTEMEQIGTKPWSFFGISPQAGVASNEFVIGSSSGTSLLVNNSGFLGLATTSPFQQLSVNGNAWFASDRVHIGNAVCNNPLAAASTKGLEVCGSDASTNGIDLGVANNSNATNAYSTVYLNNDLADNTVTHYGALSLNSSKYTDTTFGTGFATANQLGIQDTDGPISLFASTSTAPGYINFFTNGVTIASERARITNFGLGIGTTSPRWGLDSASSTGPQLALSDAVAADNHWTLRNISNNFYLATASPSTFATSTNAVLSILSSATANATTTLSLSDWVQKQTSQTALTIMDAFGTIDALFNTASTTGSVFTVAATTTTNAQLNAGTPIKLFDVDQYGHLMASSTGPAQPTVTCSPSGGTLSATSNDVAGTITGGTLSTSCTLTFARAYAITPVVQSTGSNIFSGVTAQSTTAFTVSMVATTGDVINYWVIQP